MRIAKIITCLLFLYTANIYAEEEQITVIEHKPTESAEQMAGDDAARLSHCEKEIRQLTGRIELLEHDIKLLQNSHSNSSDQTVATSIITPALERSNTKPSTDAIIAQTPELDSNIEKREYDTALAALKDSKFTEAESMFSNFIQKYPSSASISNAYFWHAESFYRRGEFDKAAVHYLKGYKQFPKSAKAADSLFKLALSLGELNKIKEACAILSKLEEEYKQRPASSIKRAYDAKMKFGCK